MHSHSPTVIPFSITQTELSPVFHRASFLSSGVPVFEIRAVAGAKNNMLVNDAKRGKVLAQALGEKNVALMRGLGNAEVRSIICRPRKLKASKSISPEPSHRMREAQIAFGKGSNGWSRALRNCAAHDRYWHICMDRPCVACRI